MSKPHIHKEVERERERERERGVRKGGANLQVVSNSVCDFIVLRYSYQRCEG
jgi:hypothetical protein